MHGSGRGRERTHTTEESTIGVVNARKLHGGLKGHVGVGMVERMYGRSEIGAFAGVDQHHVAWKGEYVGKSQCDGSALGIACGTHEECLAPIIGTRNPPFGKDRPHCSARAYEVHGRGECERGFRKRLSSFTGSADRVRLLYRGVELLLGPSSTVHEAVAGHVVSRARREDYKPSLHGLFRRNIHRRNVKRGWAWNEIPVAFYRPAT